MDIDLNKNTTYPIVIDGGLSNVLEGLDCALDHPLWTAQLLATNPEAIVETHYRYIKAGARIISTISYQATLQGFQQLGYSVEKAKYYILRSVDLAHQAIDKARNENKLKIRPLVAASIGPYGAFLADGSEYKGNYKLPEDELIKFHEERIKLFARSKADLLAFETIPDYQEAKVLAVIMKDISKPAWLSFSCRDDSTISDGTSIEKSVELFRDHPSIFAVGVNCTAPKYLSNLIKKIRLTGINKRIIAYPNSGEIYNPRLKVWEDTGSSANFHQAVDEWLDLGVDIIGGCCRIGPGHIEKLVKHLNSP